MLKLMKGSAVRSDGRGPGEPRSTLSKCEAERKATEARREGSMSRLSHPRPRIP